MSGENCIVKARDKFGLGNERAIISLNRSFIRKSSNKIFPINHENLIVRSNLFGDNEIALFNANLFGHKLASLFLLSKFLNC